MGSRTIAVAAPLLLLFAACSHSQPAPESVEQRPVEMAPPALPPAPAEQAAAEPPKAEPPPPAPRPRLGLAASVYFAFDDANLDADARALLDGMAQELGRDAEAHVRVEGNCDERGTSEYNLALGQRRADAARGYLANVGVANDRISTMSWGKERPKATGHDEESWRANRRDDVFIAMPALVGAR